MVTLSFWSGADDNTTKKLGLWYAAAVRRYRERLGAMAIAEIDVE